MESWVRVRSVFVKPAVSRGHENGLKHYNAIYTLQRSKLSTFTLGAGAQIEFKPILTNFESPKLVIIGVVGNSAFHGKLSIQFSAF